MESRRRQRPAKREIRNLLIVILSGVACAFLLSTFLIYNYGPSGRYFVQNALLSPELTSTLSYNDTNYKTGGTSRYIFENIEYSYIDPKTRQQRTVFITPEQYARAYSLIAGDQSILDPSDEILTFFSKGNMASLDIKVRTESHAAWQDETRTFQEVDFAGDGNHFRIGLHDEKSKGKWVYFHHQHIMHDVQDLLINQDTI